MAARLKEDHDLDKALTAVNRSIGIINKNKEYASDYKESLIDALLLKSSILIEKRLFKVLILCLLTYSQSSVRFVRKIYACFLVF